MNQVALIGRLVRPVEVQETNGGRTVVNNTLAVQRIGSKTEEGQTIADFIPVVFWGNLAQLVSQYCGKGNQIGVNGRLISRSYMNKQEQQVFVVELVAEALHFLEAKKEQEIMA